MNAKIEKLHQKARRAIQSGEDNFRDAAECLANAQELGATQRQSAKAIGKSPAWVNALLKWRRSGYKDQYPFPRSERHVQPAEQRKVSRPPTSAERSCARSKSARPKVVRHVPFAGKASAGLLSSNIDRGWLARGGGCGSRADHVTDGNPRSRGRKRGRMDARQAHVAVSLTDRGQSPGKAYFMARYQVSFAARSTMRLVSSGSR
jgi:hypothetical protein